MSPLFPLRRLALVALAAAMGMAPFTDYVGRHRAPVPAFSSPQDVLAHRDTIRLAY